MKTEATISEAKTRKRLRLSADFSADIRVPPDEYIFEWAIGKFLILFQQLELHICSWLALQMNISFEDIVVLLKDSNFHQKISILKNVFPRVDDRKKQLTYLVAKLLAVNDFQNKIAHGVVIVSDRELYLSMPSKDFMVVNERHKINPLVVMEHVSDCRNLIGFFAMHRMATSISKTNSKNK
jgi:hypothetical protein